MPKASQGVFARGRNPSTPRLDSESGSSSAGCEVTGGIAYRHQKVEDKTRGDTEGNTTAISFGSKRNPFRTAACIDSSLGVA